MQEFLTELEVLKVEQFCQDKVMFDAVRKILLKGIYSEGVVQKGFKHDPLQNAAFNLASQVITNPIPDAELGANLRGMWAGVNYLHNAYKELERIKSLQSPYVEETNEAI